MEGPPDPRERIASLCTSMRRLAAYDRSASSCLTGPAGDLEPSTRATSSSAGLQEVAHAAAATPACASGSSRRIPRSTRLVSFVNSIAEALALLDEAGLADVGPDGRHLQPLPTSRPIALAAVASRRHGLACRRRAAGAGPHGSSPPGRRRYALGRARRRPPCSRLGRLPRRRDLLDARRASGHCLAAEAARRAFAAASQL